MEQGVYPPMLKEKGTVRWNNPAILNTQYIFHFLNEPSKKPSFIVYMKTQSIVLAFINKMENTLPVNHFRNTANVNFCMWHQRICLGEKKKGFFPSIQFVLIYAMSIWIRYSGHRSTRIFLRRTPENDFLTSSTTTATTVPPRTIPITSAG